MASIKRYKKAKGYGWRVQYRAPDGTSRTKQGFRTKDEAQTWAAANTIDQATGSWIDPTAGKVTVNALGGRWLASLTHLKPSTMNLTERTWRVHVQPAWGHRQIASIKPSEVQAWIGEIPGSGTTVRRAHACLAQILDTAVMDDMIKANPARGVKLPKKNRARKVFLTADQLATLAGECSRHGELVFLLGTVGLRWGEAVALRVEDIDFLRGRALIHRNAVWVGSELHVGTPKTHEQRSVAIPRFVLEMLSRVCAGKARSDYLWVNRQGLPLRPPHHSDWYGCALERVMAADPGFPRVTVHGLRHVAAGLMVSAGANVKVVQRQLGHASAAMTLDTYAELFDGDLDEVALALDASLRGVV